MATALPLTAHPQGVLLRVKVVPGASRSRLAGLLGDRLKVAVAAPPEGGKANDALCDLLAEAFGLPRRRVTVVEGPSQPRKTVLLQGPDLPAAEAALRPLL